MSRLVKKRRKELNAQDIRGLWELIDFSRSQDKDYFGLCRNLKQLLKTGSDGELDGIPDAEKVVANLAHAHISTFLPAVFFSEPDNVCTPTHPRHEGKEKTWSSLLNHTQRKTGYKREVKKAVLDAAVYPEGWLKHFVVRPPQSEDIQSGEGARGRTEIVGPITEDGDQDGPTEWLTKGAPAVARISPTQVVVDYLSTDRDPNGARFVDVVYLKTLSDLQSDPRYKNVKDIDRSKALTGGGKTITDGQIDPFSLTDEFQGMKVKGSDQDVFVLLHEVWVYQLTQFGLYKQLVVLLEGVDGLIGEKPIRDVMGWEKVMGDYVDQFPLERLVFNEVPDDLPNSELGVWSGMGRGVNWLLTRLVQFVDNQKQIYEVQTSRLKSRAKAMSQLKKGGPRTFVEVSDGTDPAVRPVQNHLSTRDDSMLLNVFFELIRRVSGQSENLQGGDKFRTATAAATSARGGQMKAAFDVDTVSDFLKSVSMKQATIIRSLVAEDGNTQFVFNVAGDPGSVDWLHFTQEDINWMPEVDIRVGSFTKPRREEEIQKAAMALQITLQALPAVPNAKVSILLRKLYEALEMTEIGKVLDREEDSAILAGAEIAIMMGGGNVEPKPGQNHVVHIRVADMILNDPQSESMDPMGLQKILAYRDQHEAMLQQLLEAQAKQNGNPVVGSNNPFASANPANIARSDTAREREAVPAVAGTGGERL